MGLEFGMRISLQPIDSYMIGVVLGSQRGLYKL